MSEEVLQSKVAAKAADLMTGSGKNICIYTSIADQYFPAVINQPTVLNV